jgi:hypothetical protein
MSLLPANLDLREMLEENVRPSSPAARPGSFPSAPPLRISAHTQSCFYRRGKNRPPGAVHLSSSRERAPLWVGCLGAHPPEIVCSSSLFW